jgi:hypothetical protein
MSFEAVHACPPGAGPSGSRVPVLVKGIALSVESGVICRRLDSPCNFRATLPEPVTTAAPPRRECVRRGLDLIPPPNRKDETMQDTVDQAYSAVPRILADIIQDAFRAVCATAAPTAQQGVLILRHRPGWAAPGEVRQGSPPGPDR